MGLWDREGLRHVEVAGHRMGLIDRGSGDPIVLLHGNPTSSYLWRGVMDELEGTGRLVAPDLIGMGTSDPLAVSGPDSYRFVEHRRFLDRLLERLDLGGRITLVVHDWGSGLGFDWARRHPERVTGIAYMEALVAPLTWADWPEAARGIFQAMRTPAGEAICLDKNVFVERILPASILRELDDDEMAAYREPFRAPGERRRPTLQWPRELPIDGDPADVHAIVAAYADWLATTPLPKLHIRAEPGFLTPWNDEVCRDWPARTEVTVRGGHFLQEDAPAEIGRAIAAWRSDLP